MRSASLIVGFLAFITWPELAWGQVRLPNTSEILEAAQTVNFTASELASRINAGEASAESCQWVSGAWTCLCVRIGATQIERWTRSASGRVEAENVRRLGSDAFWFGQVVLEVDTFEIGLLVWGKPEVLTARKSIVHHGETGVEAELVDLAGGTLLNAAEVAYGSNQDGVTITSDWRAARAIGRGAKWTLEELSSGGITSTLVHSGQTSSGALPPVFRVAQGTPVEFEGAYYVSWLDTIMLAVVAPGGWYGLGAAYLSDEGKKALRGEIRFDEAEGVDPYIEGQFALSDSARTRVSIQAEWPASVDSAKVRDIERGTLFRPWTLSEGGLNLSGDTHALAVRGGILTDVAPNKLGRFGVQYATTMRTREHLEVDVDIEERTFARGTARAHDAMAGVRVKVPFGEAGRWSVTPDVNTVLNFGVLPEEAGFEASTSGAVLLGVESTLDLDGRFEGWRHSIQPGLRIQTEVYGFSQRTVPPAGSIGFPFARVPQWTATWLNLDQTFDFSTFTIGLPVGVLFSGEGLSSFENPVGSAGLNAGANGFYVEGVGVCEVGCERLAMSGLLEISQSSWGIWGTATTTMSGALRVRQAWSRRLGTITNWRLSATGQGESPAAYAAGSYVQIRAIKLGAAAVYSPGNDAFSGAMGSLSYVSGLLGWQWNASFGTTLEGGWNGSLNWSLMR